MSKRLRIVGVLVVIGLASAAGLIWLPRPHAAEQPARNGAVIAVQDLAALDHLLASHHGAALIDFHAAYCAPCKELEPRVAALALRHPNIQVLSVDVLFADDIAKRFAVEPLPLLVRLEDGHEVARQVGVLSDAALRRWMGLPDG
jgi:thioredoxin 1